MWIWSPTTRRPVPPAPMLTNPRSPDAKFVREVVLGFGLKDASGAYADPYPGRTAKLAEDEDRMSFVPPVPGMNSYAYRSPPPPRSTVAPFATATFEADKLTALPGGPALVISAPAGL